MQIKTLLLLNLCIVCSIAHGQTPVSVPPSPAQASKIENATPDQMGDADPLDVLEKKPTVSSPNLSPGTTTFTDVPEPEIIKSSEPESLLPAEAVPRTVKKSKWSKKLAKSKSQRSEISTSLAGDDPDLKKEEYFHTIYQKYNSQPTSEESWEKAMSSRKAEVYKIQNKDTLWDVSNTFFGDANYWPKIWSLNVGEIGNPHEIDPKMSIQFYPGSMADAPTVGVIESQKLEGQKGDNNLIASNANIPLPTGKKKTPLLHILPPSIPLYRYGSVLIPKPTFDFTARITSFPEQPEFLSYYVMSTEPAAIGQIVETEMGMSTASEFQYIIVKLDKEAGKELIAVKELGRVKDIGAQGSPAHLVEVQGSIEVLERVNDRENMYRAIVKKNLQPITIGSKLMPGPLPTFDPAPTAVTSEHSAVIVGGQYENERKLFGSRAIVFINGGSGQGFQEGQSLNIFSDIRNRNPQSKAQTNDRLIGTIKIVKISENFSTAFVTHATDDISVGDHVGSNTMVATAPNVKEPSADSSSDELKGSDAQEKENLDLEL